MKPVPQITCQISPGLHPPFFHPSIKLCTKEGEDLGTRLSEATIQYRGAALRPRW